MKVSELGEFGLIERLALLSGQAPPGEIWSGDDAAVVRMPEGNGLFTTDMLVEGVHFDASLTEPADVGYKSLAVNISDIAAMGGEPLSAVVCLGVPPDLGVGWTESLYSGLSECAVEFGVSLVGGDISRSACLVVSIALLGRLRSKGPLTRGGARPGDVLCVTGTLGESAAGYRLLRAGIRDRPDLLAAHLRPVPRVREMKELLRFDPSAAIDVSDGFASDLSHLCHASSVGATVVAARLPVADLAGVELDRDPLEMALHGGEDYEILFTIPDDRAADAAAAVLEATGTRVSIVGDVDGGEILIELESKRTKLEPRGWDHLRP